MTDTLALPASGFGLLIRLHHHRDAVTAQYSSRAAGCPEQAAGLVMQGDRRTVKILDKMKKAGNLACFHRVACQMTRLK